MTRRRITAHKAHHVPNPTDRGAAQYIGTVPPLPPEVPARWRWTTARRTCSRCSDWRR